MDDRLSVKSPIILIGMHRSGTTMVAKLLEDLGLFMGTPKDDNNESKYFVKLNRLIMNQAGASWDNPTPVRAIYEYGKMHDIVAEYMEQHISSVNIINYLGVKNYLNCRSLQNFKRAWGWKDPRNTFTLRTWLKVFPLAKVINISRHGVDVASSLKVRVDSILESGEWRRKRDNFPILFNSKRSRPSFSPRCYSMEGGFSLWEEYMSEGMNVVNLSENSIDIQYESLLADPYRYLTDLVEFCGLDPSSILLEKTIEQVKLSRAYAHKKDQELVEFSAKVSARLARFNY